MRSRSLIDRLTGFATARPLPVIVAVGLLTGVALLAVRDLRLGGSIYELFPDAPGPIADLGAHARLFGGKQQLVALVSGPDAARTATATRELAERLGASPLVREVQGALDLSASAAALSRSLLLLIDEGRWPEARRRLTTGLQRQVTRLRRMLLAPVGPERALLTHDPLLLSELLVPAGQRERPGGALSSADGRHALLFAEPTGRSSDIAFCGRLRAALAALTRELDRDGVRVRFTGAHLYAHHMAEALQRDLAVSGLLALLGIALVQLVFFRSMRIVPLSALVVSVSLAWTLAVAVVTVGHLSALSLSFAALCIGMGDDALIHIAASTRRFAELPPPARMRRAVSRVAPAVVAATLTIVAAFASFSLSAFAGLAHTGLLAACGLLGNALLAVLLFPAIGALWPPGPGPAGATLIDRWLAGLSGLAQRRRLAVLGVAAALVVAALLAVRGLRFSEDVERLVPAELPPAATDRAIAAAFGRDRHRLLVLLEGRDLERVLQVHDRLAGTLRALEREGALAGSASIARLLPSRATQRARSERLRALDPQAVVARLRAALQQQGLRPEPFAPFFAALTSPRPLTLRDLPAGVRRLAARQLALEPNRAVVVAVAFAPPGADAARLAARLARLSGGGVSVRVTGATLAGAQMATLLRRDLWVISGATLAAVLLLLGLLVRRAWPVAATALSLLVAGVLFAACLELLGIEVDLYNLMVIPVIIGYGVDDHLYLVHRTLDEGLDAGVVEGGRPVLAATLSTIAALGALCFCQIPGLRALGLTGMLGLGLGMGASLVVMPALLALSPRYRGAGGAAPSDGGSTTGG